MKEYLEKNREELLKDLKELVSYRSVLMDDEKPFGSENRKALDAALKMMADKGMRTENLDYYCGYGEVGEGEEVIGILAHLDVVPVSDGWDSDPFEMVEKDGKVYGRGVADDKGPAVASMYAVKYLLETGYPFKKRLRLILGCNEETGSLCIRHYVEKCGHIDCGFTPDGSFPGILGEKGMYGGKLVAHDTKILDLKGGEASNIVCRKAECELPLHSFDKEKLDGFFKEHNIAYTLEEADTIKLTVIGKAAHASTPDEGVNAINHLLEGLYVSGMEDPFVEYFHRYFGLDLHGERLGFPAIADEYSDTSINFGVAGKNGKDIEITMDMRFPVKSHVADIERLLAPLKEKENELVKGRGVEPLFFDKDTPMIKALKKAYEDVTGDKESEMAVIGGGTYAKAIHNCIAFGAEFEGDVCNIHDANENIEIGKLLRQIEIYVEAIRNLNEV